MDVAQLQKTLGELIERGDAQGFAAVVDATEPHDLVDALDAYSLDQVAGLLLLLPTQRPELFAHFPPDKQDGLLSRLPREVVVELFERMPSDDRADLFNRLAPAEREHLLPALAQLEREDILRLAAYPEGTVGAITTSDYATLAADMSVADALQAVREGAPDKETIYELYVLDAQRRLRGTVSLRELVLAQPDTAVADLMSEDPVSVVADAPQEEAAERIRHYDLLAVPVLDREGQMVGIVTVDDAMDVDQQEATEDMLMTGGHGGGGTDLSKVSLLHASAFQLYRMRVFWLLVLVFGNLFSGAGLAYFEETIAAYIALVFFLPLLIDSGGNAGSQAATLMVRALAMGDVVMKDWFRLLGREFGVAVLLGATMAMAVSGIGLFRAGPDIALVVALSMVVIVVIGSLIGMSLPFVLSRLKLDPATASAPLVTSISDATGVLIYLSIAVLVLGAPA